MADPVLLLTRPEAQSRRFAAEVAARLPDLPVLIAPMQEIRPRSFALPENVVTLVLTSENGALGLPDGLDLTAYCVGERTAEAARAHGLRTRVAEGDAVSLLRLLRRDRPAGPLFHPHGQHVAVDLVAALTGEFEIADAVAYDQAALPLSPAARALLAGDAPVLLPLFSPRSARLFAGEAARAPLRVAAISAAAAAAWPGPRPERLAIAQLPSSAAMVEAVAGLAS